ncbi:hypothetical protein TNCT_268751 [Trichonephila clavata]|uniref:Uncharacterized protein n=1 Tax=Trichonephila clavata TaxID=2740835 RepID=A0A8X6G527_TRICU|nr:hypothetical protein TNCT_268751 [Trichonephila clavata]
MIFVQLRLSYLSQFFLETCFQRQKVKCLQNSGNDPGVKDAQLSKLLSHSCSGSSWFLRKYERQQESWNVPRKLYTYLYVKVSSTYQERNLLNLSFNEAGTKIMTL